MKRGNVLITAVVMLIIFLLLMTGCTKRLGYTGTNIPGHIKASYMLYSGSEKSAVIQASTGQTIYFAYSSKVEKGALTMTVIDEQGRELVNLPAGKPGVKELDIQNNGKYFVVVRAEAAKGFFDIYWEVR